MILDEFEIRVPGLGDAIHLDWHGMQLFGQHRWWVSAKGYLARGEEKETVYFHRELLNAGTGDEIDHINRNRLDNRLCNLRFVTRSQNLQNSFSKRRGRSSKYKGVVHRRNKKKNPYIAAIKHNGRVYWLGSFRTEEEAALAYDKKALELYGPAAYTNIL